jgi:Kdo2-lipid IVA lauroyltransferase/acyltransferase
MKAIGFYIFFLTNWIITLLPLRVLYLFSDFIFLFIYYFPGYRRKIVRTNLKKSFPEKTEQEIAEIEKCYYRHLADLFVEIFKLTHMSRRQLKKRFFIENPELLDRLRKERRDIVAICGHYNNWEWMTAIPLYTDYKCISIFKPLKNKYFEWFINGLRTKHGMVLAPMSNIIREIITDRNAGINTFSAFIADQIPAKGDINYWTRFLNQETAVYLGAEKIAAKYDMAVIFFNNQKIKRGYYRIKAELLFEHTAGLPDHCITEAHVRRLEEIISDKPQYWIWSHRRWKHKREQPDG